MQPLSWTVKYIHTRARPPAMNMHPSHAFSNQSYYRTGTHLVHSTLNTQLVLYSLPKQQCIENKCILPQIASGSPRPECLTNLPRTAETFDTISNELNIKSNTRKDANFPWKTFHTGLQPANPDWLSLRPNLTRR